MGPTTEIRRALKERFRPYVVDRGFVVDERQQPTTTTYRREADGSVQIFEIQWDKYARPRFAVHFGTCPVDGLRVGDDLLSPDETLATWCPDRGTLRSDKGAWFRQDAGFIRRHLGAKPRDPDDIVDELLAIFPELERHWADGSHEPHVRLWGG
jgi:hypothetical protein